MKNIPEIPLQMKPDTPEAEAAIGFRWADETVGKRSKIGGSPEHLQEPAVPTCDNCGETMTFYAQIDSVGDDISLADVGMAYLFVCFGCFMTKSFIQSG
ncbi:MAG: hypothetical protein KI788_05450 [Mameliella sp.]|nr:hypothetical protein [Mameliella sp.]